jgi:hypothetical protein
MIAEASEADEPDERDQAAIAALIAAALTLTAAAKQELVRRLIDALNAERARDEGRLPPTVQRDLWLVQALRSVADVLGHPPSTTEYIAAYKRARTSGDSSLPSVSTFIKRYRSWRAALFAAGVIGPPHSNLIDQRRVLRGRPFVYPRERVLTCLRGCAADLRRVPTVRDYEAWRDEKRQTAIAGGRVYPDFPCPNTVYRHFGGWGKALRAAGFDDRFDRRNPPDWWTPIEPPNAP